MKVIFNKNDSELREIADVSSFSEAVAAVSHFLKEHQYAAPYWRYWMDNEWVMIDVGCHTQWFQIEVGADFDLNKALGMMVPSTETH